MLLHRLICALVAVRTTTRVSCRRQDVLDCCSSLRDLGPECNDDHWCHAAWGEYALDHATHDLRLDLSGYHFKLFVLPGNSDCDFAGMGFMNCAKDPGMLCHSFINGKKWTVRRKGAVPRNAGL